MKDDLNADDAPRALPRLSRGIASRRRPANDGRSSVSRPMARTLARRR